MTRVPLVTLIVGCPGLTHLYARDVSTFLTFHRPAWARFLPL